MDVIEASAAKCIDNVQISVPVSICLINSSIQRQEIAVTKQNIIQSFEALKKSVSRLKFLEKKHAIDCVDLH